MQDSNSKSDILGTLRISAEIFIVRNPANVQDWMRAADNRTEIFNGRNLPANFQNCCGQRVTKRNRH